MMFYTPKNVPEEWKDGRQVMGCDQEGYYLVYQWRCLDDIDILFFCYRKSRGVTDTTAKWRVDGVGDNPPKYLWAMPCDADGVTPRDAPKEWKDGRLVLGVTEDGEYSPFCWAQPQCVLDPPCWRCMGDGYDEPVKLWPLPIPYKGIKNPYCVWFGGRVTHGFIKRTA